MGALDRLGPNILSTNGKEWLKHRRLTEPAFSEQHLRLVAKEAVATMKLIKEEWDNKAETNEPIDVVKDMTRITFDVIVKAAFGYDLKLFEKNHTFDQSKYFMTLADALKTALDGLAYEVVVPTFVKKLLQIIPVDNYGKRHYRVFLNFIEFILYGRLGKILLLI